MRLTLLISARTLHFLISVSDVWIRRLRVYVPVNRSTCVLMPYITCEIECVNEGCQLEEVVNTTEDRITEVSEVMISGREALIWYNRVHFGRE